MNWIHVEGERFPIPYPKRYVAMKEGLSGT